MVMRDMMHMAMSTIQPLLYSNWCLVWRRQADVEPREAWATLLPVFVISSSFLIARPLLKHNESRVRSKHAIWCTIDTVLRPGNVVGEASRHRFCTLRTKTRLSDDDAVANEAGRWGRAGEVSG